MIAKGGIKMLGNFEFCNPSNLYFGDEAIKFLNSE